MRRDHVKLTKAEAERFSRDLATTEERKWLDAWEVEVNPTLSPSIIDARLPDGRVNVLVLLRRRHVGVAFGVYCTSLKAIKADVMHCRKRREQIERSEVEAAIGAFI